MFYLTLLLLIYLCLKLNMDYSRLNSRMVELSNNCTPENTKKTDTWAFNLYKSWANANQGNNVDIAKTIEKLQPTRVNFVLSAFFINLKK